MNKIDDQNLLEMRALLTKMGVDVSGWTDEEVIEFGRRALETFMAVWIKLREAIQKTARAILVSFEPSYKAYRTYRKHQNRMMYRKKKSQSRNKRSR